MILFTHSAEALSFSRPLHFMFGVFYVIATIFHEKISLFGHNMRPEKYSVHAQQAVKAPRVQQPFGWLAKSVLPSKTLLRSHFYLFINRFKGTVFFSACVTHS